ncbi:hypothetical protein [Boseongicola aestuarii]|uniref:hypothetical protein n=1 Tax=Boseongicola aestuarii TaxID=1470561 RepID=UPI001130DAFC|nr:hypothetical protein [Boseongicola aestuarii]
MPKLTIVAPFVAFIILHNEPLQPVLELSDNRHSNPVIDYLALARFDIFYLGLIIIGLGVGLFSLFSPKQVTGYRSYDAFLEAKLRSQSPNSVIGSLRLSLEKFLAASREEPALVDPHGHKASFPRRFNESMAALLENALSREELSEHQLLKDNDEPAIDRILQIMHHREPSQRSIWKHLFAAMPQNAVDIYRIEYLVADYSRPAMRLSVFCFLGIGICVMLVPTIITTFLVIDDLTNAGAVAVSTQ